MSEPHVLVRCVDYRRLAIQQGGVSGIVSLSCMPRVAAEGQRDVADDDTIAVDLMFFEDAQRRVRVEGSIQATLCLQCQRCLKYYDQPVNASVAGVVVADDEAAANVPRDDEPVLADGDTLDIHVLVSDELLLALPSVARCDREECRTRFERAAQPRAELGDEDDENERKNPFAVLKELKRDPEA